MLNQVQLFLLDMDGTFNLGNEILEGSLDFIDVLRRQGRDFIFLTNNSSRSASEYVEKITRLGLPITREKVFTSGEATALFLQKTIPGGRIFLAGTQGLADEFLEHGFTLDETNPDAAVLGFDTTMTYQKMWKLCDLVRAGLPYYATHPDFNCPTPTGYMPDIGAMIAFVKASTGREPDVVIGKPNRTIVDILAEKKGLPGSAIAMVGDRLYTDIALGKSAGITSVLVLSGETHPEDLPGSPFKPDYTFDHLGALGKWLVENSESFVK
jgi:HAD superfamily hydrolase (TIGR01450 family)